MIAVILLGREDILKWANDGSISWKEGPDACVGAALGGHLEVLKWARENGCPLNERVTHAACEGGHIELLKWLKEQGCPFNGLVSRQAAMDGNKIGRVHV